ncbi:MAG: hypothetical protein RLZZ466_655 [Bacteroidota bacterium]|jgi:hypothetical protein
MFKKLIIVFAFIIPLLSSFNANAQNNLEVCYNPNLVKDTSKKSLNALAVYVVENDSIIISYHSPGVRNRIIWGGLVPFGEVWVTGAHDATYLVMPNDFIVAGNTIPAGKYAFFTIPGQKEWTLIINKNWSQHLASEYDEKEDIVRIKVKPKKVNHTERLQYFIEMESNSSGKISVAWEKIKLEMPFTLK